VYPISGALMERLLTLGSGGSNPSQPLYVTVCEALSVTQVTIRNNAAEYAPLGLAAHDISDAAAGRGSAAQDAVGFAGDCADLAVAPGGVEAHFVTARGELVQGFGGNARLGAHTAGIGSVRVE